jgi:RNA polymerase sigma-70 factor (ECF subfamily)
MHHDGFTAIAVGLVSSLYNAAFRLTRDERDAEDLVQDTYAYAFEHANELRSAAAAKTWLLRILYHRFISLRRTSRARPELKVLEGGLEESSVAVEAALRLERATIGRLSRPAITKALERLPEQLRTAVVMCDVEGFSYQEIAEIMACPVGTVRSRIARAREHLMRALAAEAAALGIGRISKQ